MIPAIFILGIALGAFGGILMKMGVSQLGAPEIHSIQDVFGFMFHLLTNVTALAGVVLYFLSAMTWSFLLTKLDISYVQPILALTYVVTPILAMFLIHETVPAMRWLGIAIIILGVTVVART